MTQTFDTTAFSRQLDGLSMAMQDNMARALREVSVIDAGIQAETIVHGKLDELKAALAKTNEMKIEVVRLLGHHRMPKATRLSEISTDLSRQIEHYRSERKATIA
jgi:hypothetical protein